MTKNTSIDICPVENGYLVRSNGNPYNAYSDVAVFQSLAALVDFLHSHFEHRNSDVISDMAATK